MIAPASRGYSAVYRQHETNHCPGCGRVQWLIGRLTAECAFCATAVPLVGGLNQREPKPFRVSRGLGGGRVR